VRLEPIERPSDWITRLGYWLSRRRLGKTPTPFKVVYARAPKLARLAYQISRTEEKALSIDPGLGLLIHVQASAHNGCGFCVDIGRALAVQRDVGLEKFEALPGYRTSPLFSDRERAALDYAGEVTRNKHVSDATFEALRKHFSEREIVEITWVNALANYYNLINVPLELESDGLCAIALGRHHA
jgi:AhpD family alkylhydroperoxidase